MATESPLRARQLASWDASRQEQYRAQHPGRVLIYHFLLDASPSMIGPHARNLRGAFNMYLEWLKHHSDPMSLGEIRCFSTSLDHADAVSLPSLKPLTDATYDPRSHGSGTALYRAVGETCVTANVRQKNLQHVLVVFTDGGDNTSSDVGWSLSQARTILTTLQEQEGWLAIFLGAFPGALEVGKSMGFQAGNCLAFPTDQIPEAFIRLQKATQKYLTATAPERKLLKAEGIF